VDQVKPYVHAVYIAKNGQEIDSVCEPDAPGVWWNKITNLQITCPACLRIMAERGILL
jgi:hypothetical protein